MSINPAAPIPR
jgi:hypothetical protein